MKRDSFEKERVLVRYTESGMKSKLALALLLLPAGLIGHDLYLMPSQFQVNPGDAIVFSVYSGDDFPQATSRGRTSPARSPAGSSGDAVART